MKLLKRMLKAPLIAAVTLLSACSADIDNYQASSPSFDLFGYFEGDVKAWGMVQDYTEKQTRRFEVDIVGTVEAMNSRWWKTLFLMMASWTSVYGSLPDSKAVLIKVKRTTLLESPRAKRWVMRCNGNTTSS